MSDVLLLGLGAVFGGVVSGALKLWEDARERERQRRVAARVFLSDIAFVEVAFEVVSERGVWPDRMDFDPVLDSWREFRAVFVGGVTAVEWSLVGTFYSHLERCVQMIQPGETCTKGELSASAFQIELAREAWQVAARHVARDKREREAVVKELSPRAEESGGD